MLVVVLAARMDEVLFTVGKDGSLSVGWRRVRGGGLGLVLFMPASADSTDDSRPLRRLNEGDLSLGRRGTVLLGRLPLLLIGEGLRDVKFNFSPI